MGGKGGQSLCYADVFPQKLLAQHCGASKVVCPIILESINSILPLVLGTLGNHSQTFNDTHSLA